MDCDEMDVDEFKQEIQANLYASPFKRDMTSWELPIIEPPVIICGQSKLVRAVAAFLRKNSSEIRAGNQKSIHEACGQLEQVLLCIPSGEMPADVDAAYDKLLDALYSSRFPVTTLVNHIVGRGLRQGSLSQYFSDILSPYDAAKLDYFLKNAHDHKLGLSVNGFRLSDFLLANCFMEQCPPRALLEVLRYGCAGLLKKRGCKLKRCRMRVIGNTDLSEDQLMCLLQYYFTSVMYRGPMTEDEIQTVADQLKIIFRSIYTFSFSYLFDISGLEEPFESFEEFKEGSMNLLKASGRFPELDERLGKAVTSLKHLCRCEIRKSLYKSWALPDGIKLLGVSWALEEYLDLKTD